MPNSDLRKRFTLPLRDSRWCIAVDPEPDGWHAYILRRVDFGPAKRATLYAVDETRNGAIAALIRALEDVVDRAQRQYRFEGQACVGDPCPRCGAPSPSISDGGSDGAMSHLFCVSCSLKLENPKPPPEPLERYKPNGK